VISVIVTRDLAMCAVGSVTLFVILTELNMLGWCDKLFTCLAMVQLTGWWDSQRTRWFKILAQLVYSRIGLVHVILISNASDIAWIVQMCLCEDSSYRDALLCSKIGEMHTWQSVTFFGGLDGRDSDNDALWLFHCLSQHLVVLACFS